MNSLQATLIKQSLGVGKRSHHTNLLQALNIPPAYSVTKQRTVSLCHRVLKTASPFRNLLFLQISKFMLHGTLPPDSLISRVVSYGVSLVCSGGCPRLEASCAADSPNGVVDSLRILIYSTNYFKPWSAEHILTGLLTRTF